MEDPIKFRAWDIRAKAMVYDACILTGVRNLVTVNEEHFNSPFSFFDGCIWMQYTGYNDIVDAEVYESDVVRVKDARDNEGYTMSHHRIIRGMTS